MVILVVDSGRKPEREMLSAYSTRILRGGQEVMHHTWPLCCGGAGG